MATMEDRNIPEELIMNEILTRLPVKSLLRFRSVCKAWHSTISSCEFISSHRHHSKSDVHAMHFSEDIPHDIGSINMESLTKEGQLQHYCRLPRLRRSYLINSSRDLLVLCHQGGYMLSNPAMREAVYLPHSPSWPDDLLPVLGFGFVSSHGKYKVVSITTLAWTQDTCQVFTVGIDNSWRIGKTPPSSIYGDGHTPYVSGNLHKLTQNDRDEHIKILRFNLEMETWTMMPLPDHHRLPSFSINRWHTELREIQGLLCFSCCIQDKGITIWMLRDYRNEVWSKDFVIDMTNPRVMPNQLKFWIKALYGLFPLNVMADGRILLRMDSIIDDRWFYYDPRDGSIQQADHKGSYVTLYAENLVPISGF